MASEFAWARDLDGGDWCAFLSGELAIPGRTAPPLPPDDFQRLLVGCAGVEALNDARVFLDHVKRAIRAAGAPMHEGMRVLDFGSGWGRLYRVLMREIPPAQLIGADPEASCIEICRRAMPFGRFVQIPVRPPYAFGDNEFDLIYLFSVFTHLDKPVIAKILDEFERIVRPGGFVSFTTLRSNHIDFWAAHSQHPAYKAALEKVGFDPVAWRAKLAGGEFLFVPTGGGSAIETADIYGWALINRSCLEGLLRERPFEITVMDEPADMGQAFVTIRKKAVS